MAHTNSFPALITVSQQLSQAHFQQTASSQMQHTAVVNSQILFPQCQQTLSLQPAQNGAMASNQQMNSSNGSNKQLQHNRQFQQQQQQPQQQQQQQQQAQHLTIPVQLGAGNHAFTTAGIPLDLSYFVQGGCLPNCLPIQLNAAGSLPQGFQAALNCVNTSSSESQVQQADSSAGNSFLQFNVAYQPTQQGLVPAFQTVMQQTATTPAAAVPPTSKPQPPATKRRKKPTGTAKAEKVVVVERFHSVAVQTDFDMSLCRQQIVVVPPKNCTCGAVAQALASGAFQAASFPPAPRKSEKHKKRKAESTLIGEIQPDEPLQAQSQPQQTHQEQIQHLSPQEQPSTTDQCNGALPAQPNCDNRGRPFSYECLYCPKRFSLHSRLVAHLRCHTGMRPFSCLQCGYSFTQRSYLNRHAAVHKQERPFSCLSCHKTYKHYGSLANHRKLHSKDPSDHHTSSVNEAGTDAAALSSTTTMAPVTAVQQQMFSSSVSSTMTSPPQQQQQQQQLFASPTATAHPTMQMFHAPAASSTSIASLTGPQMFHASSSSSQPMAATFYQAHDASGFLLSLNTAAPSSSAPSSGATTGTMLLLHPSNNNANNNNTITAAAAAAAAQNSSSSSAYAPTIMSSSAFS